MSRNFAAPLSSARLILRRLSAEDAAALSRYRSLPEVARHQSWETFGPADAARLIEKQHRHEPAIPGTWFQLAIAEQLTGTLVGDCGLHCLKDEPRQMEIGITMAPAYQRKGYATEAIKRLLEYIFGALGMHRVLAMTDAENVPAGALFRTLGFRQEAHLIEHRWFKGRWQSEFLFALLEREWDLRRQTAP